LNHYLVTLSIKSDDRESFLKQFTILVRKKANKLFFGYELCMKHLNQETFEFHCYKIKIYIVTLYI
jgi:hypothetical protein